ncbi:MAG: GTPase Era [Ruminococcus sp.]|jgi:GTP-binding protein Era|nr:GTPase Era [Ruminococcus sp.]
MTKSLFVTIIGLANAGKSSLTNALTGEKIAAVTYKPQTTRTRITGIKTDDKTGIQYVFTDTPGIVPHTKNRLNERMNKTVKEAESGADLLLIMVDLTKKTTETEQNLIRSRAFVRNKILLLNKTDTVKDKALVAERIAQLTSICDFSEVIPISVKTGDNLDVLRGCLERFAKESVHFFPDDKFTDQSEQLLASEFIRENALLLLDDEIPHGIAVGIEKFAERDTKSGETILDIEAVIYCERESHKGIIIGKKGSMLKKIGETSRIALENFFAIKVNLQLWVKVKEDWRNRENFISQIMEKQYH